MVFRRGIAAPEFGSDLTSPIRRTECHVYQAATEEASGSGFEW
jgi:hypothetical protein